MATGTTERSAPSFMDLDPWVCYVRQVCSPSSCSPLIGLPTGSDWEHLAKSHFSASIEWASPSMAVALRRT